MVVARTVDVDKKGLSSGTEPSASMRWYLPRSTDRSWATCSGPKSLDWRSPTEEIEAVVGRRRQGASRSAPTPGAASKGSATNSFFQIGQFQCLDIKAGAADMGRALTFVIGAGPGHVEPVVLGEVGGGWRCRASPPALSGHGCRAGRKSPRPSPLSRSDQPEVAGALADEQAAVIRQEGHAPCVVEAFRHGLDSRRSMRPERGRPARQWQGRAGRRWT